MKQPLPLSFNKKWWRNHSQRQRDQAKKLQVKYQHQMMMTDILKHTLVQSYIPIKCSHTAVQAFKRLRLNLWEKIQIWKAAKVNTGWLIALTLIIRKDLDSCSKSSQRESTKYRLESTVLDLTFTISLQEYTLNKTLSW